MRLFSSVLHCRFVKNFELQYGIMTHNFACLEFLFALSKQPGFTTNHIDICLVKATLCMVYGKISGHTVWDCKWRSPVVSTQGETCHIHGHLFLRIGYKDLLNWGNSAIPSWYIVEAGDLDGPVLWTLLIASAVHSGRLGNSNIKNLLLYSFRHVLSLM